MTEAFKCKMCGSCCYGEGGITLDEDDIKRISEYLKIDETDLLKRFCHIRDGRVSVITGPDNVCVFYRKKKGCIVHPVKPKPCRRWPYYDALIKDRENWELAKDACPGLRQDCTHEDFVKEAMEWLSSNT